MRYLTTKTWQCNSLFQDSFSKLQSSVWGFHGFASFGLVPFNYCWLEEATLDTKYSCVVSGTI